MALRGKKPDDRPKRLKLLMSGPAGVGKTMAAIQMPRPYLIDTERGAVHYGDELRKSGGVVYEAKSMDDVIAEVRSLCTEKHDYLTVIIDPITTVYHALGDEGERKVGTEYQKHYKQYADKFVRRLCGLLTEIDMNVVVTAHAKNKWGKIVNEKGKEEHTIIGETFDGYDKLDYIFDLWLRLEKKFGDTARTATVMKTRFKEFDDQEQFAWSYAELVKRFGKDKLEASVKSMALATPEQVAEFNSLIKQFSQIEIEALKIDKVLSEYADVADMPADRIAKGIGLLTSHLTRRLEPVEV